MHASPIPRHADATVITSAERAMRTARHAFCALGAAALLTACGTAPAPQPPRGDAAPPAVGSGVTPPGPPQIVASQPTASGPVPALKAPAPPAPAQQPARRLAPLPEPGAAPRGMDSGLGRVPAEEEPFALRPAVTAWAADVAQRNGLDADWIRGVLAQARREPTIARLILPAPAGTLKDWTAYRGRFVEPRRIRAGLAFWQAHSAWLTKAETQYGVPAQIIVGLIGVETIYGQQMGTFRVLDALATLGFAYPAQAPTDRGPYFRNELEQFLLLCRETGMAPDQVLGSYAGAMGMPQFMPRSWRRWAVDYDGDGRVDLAGSPADAIGSVANYLAEHGWHRDMPTHFPVQPPEPGEALDRLLATDIVPAFAAAQMAELGARLGANGPQHDGLLALVKLENGPRPPHYVAGTDNFYALTRYNQSSYYALAVIELGQAVGLQRAATR